MQKRKNIMQKRYFKVDKGVLIPRSGPLEIDRTEYTVIERRRRFTVSQHKESPKFLIHVGFRDIERVTIVCEGMGELIHALALVRTAFPTKKK